jgi:uncharacterized membrane protein YsdA (DUF1294 family)
MTRPVAEPLPAPSRRLRRAVRDGRIGEALVFGAVYGPVLAALAALGIAEAGQAMGDRARVVVLVFLVAGLAGGAAAWTVAALLARHRPASARFAAMLVLLMVSTAGAVALAQFVQLAAAVTWIGSGKPLLDRLFSPIGIGLKAVYVTAAAGLPLVLPWGVAALLAGAAAFAIRTRSGR